MQTFRISKKLLETIASASLRGLLWEAGITISDDRELHLEFETFTLQQCRQNDGPDLVIIPEYVPMCLLECVLSFIKNGWTVTVGQYHTS